MTLSQTLATKLTGRQSELEILDNQLRKFASGSGQVTFVVGEAGVGKTRLIQEFVHRIEVSPHYEIMVGHCYEADSTVPYGPFVDLLSHMEQKQVLGWSKQATPRKRQVLAKLLPDLAELPPDPAPSETPIEKKFLFSTLCDLLCYGANHRVIILEDFHWADQTSQELLQQLVRTTDEYSVFLLCTFRSEALSHHNTNTQWMEQLTRERRYLEIRLRTLTLPELTEMVENILKRPLPRPFIETFYELTGGNPFFAEETLKELLQSQTLEEAIRSAVEGSQSGLTSVPISFRENILRRVINLDGTVREVLFSASVLGHRFDLDWLLQLTGFSEKALLDVLQALIDLQLIAEEERGDGDWYYFRHALTREAIYSNMQGRERVIRHRAVMQIFEGQKHKASIDQLAYHSFRARLFEKARHYSQLAGEYAMRIGAYREAAVHFRVALSLTSEENMPARAELLLDLANAVYPSAGAELRVKLWKEAQACFEQIGNPIKVAEICRLLGQTMWEKGDTPAGIEYAYHAVTLLETLSPSPELVKSIGQLSSLYMLSQQSQRCIECGEKALVLAQALGCVHLNAGTLISMGCAYRMLGDIRRGMEYMRQGHDLARKGSEWFTIGRYFVNMGDTLVVAGEYRKVLQLYDTYEQFAQDSGWEVHRPMMLVCLADALLELGEWERAEGVIERTIHLGADIPVARTASIPRKAELLRRKGQFQNARELLEEIRPVCERLGDFFCVGYMLSALGRVYISCHEPERAAAIMDQCIDRWNQTDARIGAEDILFAGMQVYFDAGYPERALELFAALKTILTLAQTPLAEIQHNTAQALVDMYNQQFDSAVQRFVQTGQLCQQQGFIYRVQECRRYIEICHQQSVPLSPSASHSIDVNAHRLSNFADLTERQIEILRLVADGLSNPEIAARLVLSEHTVHRHIANILTKLDLPSRAAAAAYAVRQGWL